MPMLDVLDLPQLYTKPSAEALLQALALLTSTPPTWDRKSSRDIEDVHTKLQDGQDTSQPPQVNPEGITRYLTSIVSSDLRWIDDDAREDIWNQASARMSERSGRTAMGAMSRRFRIPSPTGPFELDIHEPTMTGDHLGLKTWAASYMLAKRLHTFGPFREGARERLQVLELGAGTGLVGLAMAGLGADVLLTDMSSIHANLARNVEINASAIKSRGGSARAGVLDWTNPTICEIPPGAEEGEEQSISCRFPLILAADSLYSPEHPHMLVDSISAWLSDEASARVIVEFPYRVAYLPEIETFRERMTQLGLHIVEEGEEQGYDDWGSSGAKEDDDDDDSVVTCWWSIWGR